MLEPVFYKTSGGSELIKDKPGMLCGFILTSGSPLGQVAPHDCIVAWYDNISATGNSYANMLAHGRISGTAQPATITWEPTSWHPFAKGLWLSVISGSPVVTTTYF